MSETIKAIQTQLKTILPDDERLLVWQQDSRVGVQKAIQNWRKSQDRTAKKQTAFVHRFDIERQYWEQGYDNIAGIDEVGRGPLAGPVIAAAVILPHNFNVLDVIDSKQLSAKKREDLYEKIMTQALAVGIGEVDATIVDDINIYEAARMAMTIAVSKLQLNAEVLLIDAMRLDLDIPQEFLIKGDARSNSIGVIPFLSMAWRCSFVP